MTQRIEQTIENVNRLYEAVTGRPPPTGEEPYAPIPPETDAARHVEEQLDRLSQLIARAGAGPAPMTWAPSAALWMTDDQIAVDVDVAGVPRESIDVSVTGNLLSVVGHRPAPWGLTPPPAAGTESRYGSFHRTIPLPRDADVGDLQVRLDKGVLEIRSPRRKLAEKATKSIPVA